MDLSTRQLQQGKRPRPPQLDEDARAYFPPSKELCTSSTAVDSSNYIKGVLHNHMPFVIKMINLLALIPHLITQDLLTQHEKELLQNHNLTEYQRKLELIRFIDQKPRGHQKLYEAVSEECEHLGHREIIRLFCDKLAVPITIQQSSVPPEQSSVPLEATGPHTAGFQPPTPPREANDSFLPETPQSSAIPKYTPITPPEEKSRSPSPPLLIRPKSITEMDRNAKILANFFLKQVSDNCDENQIKELGVILLGPTTYDRLQQKAMTSQNKLVELIFFEWITSRGKYANYTELSDAFKKMRHQNLYDRLCFYRREEGRLYCAEIFTPVS